MRRTLQQQTSAGEMEIYKMNAQIPGTILPKQGDATIFSLLSPFFTTTGGMMLSQICEITGLEPSTLQNWVKRGWVSNPVRKRYHKDQVARILIINILRRSFQLERIAQLLSYINSSTDCAVGDSQLYDIFCNCIDKLDANGLFDLRQVNNVISCRLKSCAAGQAERLHRALQIMIIAYQSGVLKAYADNMLANAV